MWLVRSITTTTHFILGVLFILLPPCPDATRLSTTSSVTRWKAYAYSSKMLSPERCSWHPDVGDVIMFQLPAMASNQAIDGMPSSDVITSGGQNFTVRVERETALDEFVFTLHDVKKSDGSKVTDGILSLEDVTAGSRDLQVGCNARRAVGIGTEVRVVIDSPVPRGGITARLRIHHTSDGRNVPVRVLDAGVLRVQGCEQPGEPPCRDTVAPILPEVPPMPNLPAPPPSFVTCLASTSSMTKHMLTTSGYWLRSCKNAADGTVHVEVETSRVPSWLGFGYHQVLKADDTRNYMDGAVVITIDVSADDNVPVARVGIGKERRIIYGELARAIASIDAVVFEYKHLHESRTRIRIELSGSNLPAASLVTAIWSLGFPGADHDAKGVVNFDFAKNVLVAASRKPSSLIVAHAVLMSTAWLVIAPLGVLIVHARSGVPREQASPAGTQRGGSSGSSSHGHRLSFLMHVVSGTCVAVLTIVGIGLSYAYMAHQSKSGAHFTSVHGRMGLVVSTAVVVHVACAILRPKVDASTSDNVQKDRASIFHKVWISFHRLIGTTLLGMAFANTFFGLNEMQKVTDVQAFRAIVIAITTIFCAVAASKLFWRYRGNKRQNDTPQTQNLQLGWTRCDRMSVANSNTRNSNNGDREGALTY